MNAPFAATWAAGITQGLMTIAPGGATVTVGNCPSEAPAYMIR